MRDRQLRDPLLDIAIGPALLHAAGRSPGMTPSHGTAPVLRLYRPAPTVAFSGRDCASPGIAAAAAAAR